MLLRSIFLIWLFPLNIRNVFLVFLQGDVFGWGNSEYGQFRSVTEEQQLSTPMVLPLGEFVQFTRPVPSQIKQRNFWNHMIL